MDKKPTVWGIALIFLLISVVVATAADLKDTTIDYTAYREIVVDDPGVIYQIKIVNTGAVNRTYRIIPDVTVIRQVGTYRIDPTDSFTLSPKAESISYFYLAFDTNAQGRLSIPVEVRSGNATTTIELVARSVGPFQQQNLSLLAVLRFIAIILLVVLIILVILALIRRGKRKKDDDNKEEVETYY